MNTPAEAVQPDPVRGVGRPILELVVEDFEARARLGATKYGQHLLAHNGRDALLDLYQELLDACAYVRQALEERSLKAQRFQGVLDVMAREGCGLTTFQESTIRAAMELPR